MISEKLQFQKDLNFAAISKTPCKPAWPEGHDKRTPNPLSLDPLATGNTAGLKLKITPHDLHFRAADTLIIPH